MGGWSAPPYTQLGRAPTPASLEPIVMCGIDAAKLDEFVDLVLNVREGFVNPEMLQLEHGRPLGASGRLRPFVRAMAATLIMYYPASEEQFEVTDVGIHMRGSMSDVGFGGTAAAGETLKQWAVMVKAEFDTQNLRLVRRADDAGLAQLSTTIVQMMGALSTWQAEQAKRAWRRKKEKFEIYT